MSPIVRFLIALTVLLFTVAGGYFSADSASATFLCGASIMLLLPLTLVCLLDVVQDAKSSANGARNRFAQTTLRIPIAVLALCSLSIGTYLLVPLVSGPLSESWGSVITGVLMAVAFIAFGIKIFWTLWCSHHDDITP